jgi:hypothetical protein
MTLEETKDLMCSADYKERFKAEYYQLKIRYEKLKDMCKKWDKGELDFTPTCPRNTYDYQLAYMSGYLKILKKRAEFEGVELE